MVTTPTGDIIVDDNKLRNHGTAVMHGLGAAVESLEDSMFLTDILISIGEKHFEYQVKPEMMAYFWPAIRDTWREKLKYEFTEEAESAWKHVFEYMASKIVEGIIRAGKG
ncbi:hypothetical protein ScPMuIL_014879 [Solemya velum]